MLGMGRGERKNHLRYPGRGLFPFVLDVREKWGREAHAFVESMVGGLPKERSADAIRKCRRAVAVALQTGVANQIHSAGKPPTLSAGISYAVPLTSDWPDELPELDSQYMLDEQPALNTQDVGGWQPVPAVVAPLGTAIAAQVVLAGA